LSSYITTAQDDKTVTLVVSGEGTTQDEARKNALRSAIEQAFGAFISSRTEVLNDNLVQDEIISLTSGNVKEFNIISETTTPAGRWISTLKATVSVSKLSSFVQNKGLVTEFNSNIFISNVKLEMANEQAEYKIINQMLSILHEAMQTAFDYTIEMQDPVCKSKEDNEWSISGGVSIKTNKNIDFVANYLLNTLKSISLKPEEVESRHKFGLSIFRFCFQYKGTNYKFYTRNEATADTLSYFFGVLFEFYVSNFIVEDNKKMIYDLDWRVHDLWSSDRFYKDEFNCVYDPKINDLTVASNKYNRSIAIPNSDELILTVPFGTIYPFEYIQQLTSFEIKPLGIVSKFKNGGLVVFEENGHGLVVHITELDLGFSGSFNWAKQKCDSRNKSYSFGYNDWRLPTSGELETIFKNKKVFQFPLFFGFFECFNEFNYTRTSQVWTNDYYSQIPNSILLRNMSSGTGHYEKDLNSNHFYIVVRSF